MRGHAVLFGVCTAVLGGAVGVPPAAAAGSATATVEVLGISGTSCTMQDTAIRPSENKSSVALQWWLIAGPGSPNTCTVEVGIHCARPTGTVRVASEFIGAVTLAESTKATIDVLTDFGTASAPPTSVSFRGPKDWQPIEAEHRSPAPASVSCAQPIRARVTSTQTVTGSGEKDNLTTRLHTISVV
ncbi:hypothetical protein GCM10010123_38530 [Pilimelia anulata]|uniref:Uncharacterized protein n=1 Tax=Pilimelia anulata TaxID=53371 RepID=A0A8J3B9B4_9ACTN|nr:hypothetical protein [Pilimelia anulata]GGK04828.1 hypothetical protein GCM10010123_38530 [Pilimelia anulata]